jgi:hypothetical protein
MTCPQPGLDVSGGQDPSRVNRAYWPVSGGRVSRQPGAWDGHICTSSTLFAITGLRGLGWHLHDRLPGDSGDWGRFSR